MPNFTQLDGQTLQYGQQGAYTLEDQKTFIQELDKQVRAADLNDGKHIKAIKDNLNLIFTYLGAGPILPPGDELDERTSIALNYFKDNRKLFLEHGIENHTEAKKLEKITNPAFSETEYAPTIAEMQGLEIDIGRLYEDD